MGLIFKRVPRQYFAVAACCCGLVISGLSFGSNAITFLLNSIADEFSVGIGSISLYQTMLLLTSGLFSPMAVKIVHKYGIRRAILAGIIIQFVSLLCFSFAPAVAVLYVSAACLGIGNAMLGAPTLIVIINNWFHKGNGIVTGLAFASAAAVAAILSPITQTLSVSIGWRYTCLIFAVFGVLFALPTLFYVTLKPSEKGLTPYSGFSSDQKEDEALTESTVEKGVYAPRSKAFYWLCVVAILCAFAPNFTSQLTIYAKSIGYTVEIGGLFISMTMIGNCISKLLVGVIGDIIGAKKSCVIVMTLSGIGCVIMYAFPSFPKSLLFIAVLFQGVSYSISGVATSMLTKDLFGSEAAGQVFSIASAVSYVSGAIASALIGYSYDWFATYKPALAFMTFAMLSSIIIVLLLYFYQKRLPEVER